MYRLNVIEERCEALFASPLQQADAPTAETVAEAIAATLGRLGVRGCALRMAQEFGDHPQEAAARMHWVRQVAASSSEGFPESSGDGQYCARRAA